MSRTCAGKGTTPTRRRRPLVFVAVLALTALVAVLGGLAARAVELDVSTYAGTPERDWAFDLALDGEGRPVLVGLAWEDPGSEPADAPGGGDIVLMRYSADGRRLETQTRLGGSGLDYPARVAIADDGRILITGTTRSADFPLVNPLQATHGGGEDGFLMILDTDATTVLVSTPLGGRGNERLEAITLDGDGNIHLAGHTTSTDLPLANALQDHHAGGHTDGFLVGLDAAAGELRYTTYLGGNGEDHLTALAALDDHRLAVAGHSSSADLPLVDPLPAGRRLDAWLSVLDTTAVRDNQPPAIDFATRLGGSSDDTVTTLAADRHGRLLMTGRTLVHDGYVDDFPSVNARQPSPGGGDSDGFLVRMNAARTALDTSTYLGGDGDDSADAIALDDAGRIHLGLTTRSRSGLPLPGAAQPVLAGGTDAWYARLDAGATTITDATYLGGSENDRLRAIALDDRGNPWLAGLTASPDFPTRNAHTATLGGGLDGFLARLGDGAAANAPPVITSTAGTNAPLGQTYRYTLTAVDPDGDALTFGIRPLPLPGNARFVPTTGELTFTPTLDEIGEHALVLSVSDGLHTVTQALTLNVPEPDPGSETTLTGRLLDANAAAAGRDVPIAGAVVHYDGITATTGPDGRFTITGIVRTNAVIHIDAESADPAPDGSPYAGFAETIPIEPHSDNVLSRPIYLPRIDAAGVTKVDPAFETLVTNPDLGVTLRIPAHTAKAVDGRDFDGEISVSEVPPGFAPRNLPDGIEPGLLLTIQPVGVTFEQPVPVTLPNIDNLSPGSEVDLFSLNPETGAFEVAGTGRVTDDGRQIVTISGGIRAATWHAPLPPGPRSDGDVPEKEAENQDPCTSAQRDSGSSVSPASGCLQTSIELPRYSTRGEARGTTLVYRADRASPHPVIPFDITIPRRSAVPERISYQLELGGVPLGAPVFLDTSALVENRDETVRAGIGFDASGLASGTYPYRVRVTSHFASSARAGFVTGEVVVVNGGETPAGQGWTQGSVNRLEISRDGVATVFGGNGEHAVFRSATAGSALEFDGNDVLSFGSVTPLERHTVELWLRVTSLPAGRPVTVIGQQKEDFACHNGWVIRVESQGRIRYHVDPRGCGGTGSGTVRTPTAVTGWNHLAATYDGSVARLYVNGVLMGQKDARLDPIGFLAVGAQRLAADASQWGRFLNGQVDEIRLWDHPRSVLDINRDMRERLTGSEPGLVGYWRMDEDDGQVVRDMGPNGWDGLLGNNETRQPNDPVWIVSGAGLRCATDDCRYESAEGDFTTLVRHADGRWTRTFPDGLRHEFNAQGLQTTSIDRNGNTTAYAYDGQNRLSAITDPAGLVTRFAYAREYLRTVTDPVGRVTTLDHDGAGNLVRVTFPDGTSRQYAYDARDLMTAESDERGFTVEREYDFTGRLKSVHLPDGSVRTTTSARTVGLVDPASGLGTEESPAPITRPEEVVSTFTDGEGRTEIIETDPFGAATAVTDAAGLTTTTGRNEDGLPVRRELPNGAVTAYEWDERGNLLAITDQVTGGTARYTWDDTYSQLTSITDSRGYTTSITLDEHGNPDLIRTPAGRVTDTDYGDSGLLERLVDPIGIERTFDYDERSRLSTLTETAGAESRTTTFGYDAAGNLESLTDAGGRTHTFTRDLMNRLTTRILPDGSAIGLDYDAEGHVTGITPPGKPEHRFSYTPMDLEQRYEPPALISGTSPTSYAYNHAQQLVTLMRPDGKEIDLTYDEAGRLEAIDIPRGTIRYAYDPDTGNLQTLTAADGGTITYGYDADLLAEVTWKGLTEGRFSLAYDTERRVAALGVGRGLPDNFYHYDFDGLLRSAGRVGIRRDSESGLITGTDLFGLVGTSREYNGFGELTRLVGFIGNRARNILDIRYTRDPLGRIIEQEETIDGVSTTIRYSYDTAGRLSEVNRDGLVTTYTYDDNGNRLSKSGPTGIETGAYDDQDRLLEYGPYSYRYTDNGELESRTGPGGTTSFDYDVLGNLMKVRMPDGEEIRYGIDARNRRIRRSRNGITEFGLLYQDQINPVARLDPENNVESLYVYGTRPNVPDYLEKGERNYRILSDHLGSPRLVVDIATGEIVQRFDYDEFGKVLTDTNPGFQPFRFAGGLYDPDTGLVRFGARDYDPRTGRWTTKDPVRFQSVDPNLYGYTLSDPVNRVDPNGFDPNILGGFGIEGAGSLPTSPPQLYSSPLSESAPRAFSEIASSCEFRCLFNIAQTELAGQAILEGAERGASTVASKAPSGTLRRIATCLEKALPGIGMASSAASAAGALECAMSCKFAR